MIRPLLSIGRYMPLDPNEGWNAYFADAAIHGGVLYPPADALITNNYPPLSFYLVGAVGQLMGDNIFAGPVIALLSLLFVAWSIYYWLRSNGYGDAAFGLLAALTFLAYAVTYARDYVAMDDPQWLAHALMMGGLLVIWKSARTTPGGIILGAVLMMAAGWTKHLLIPLPVTVSLWLLWRSRPAFAKWVISASRYLGICRGAGLVAFTARGCLRASTSPASTCAGKPLPRQRPRCGALPPCRALAACAGQGAPRGAPGFRKPSTCSSHGAVALFAAGGAGVDVNSFFEP